MSKSIRLLAAMVVSLAFTAFLMRHQNSDKSVWIVVAMMMAIIAIPFMIPAITTFILNRPRKVFWTGIAMVLMAMGGLFAVIFASAFYGFPKGITGDDLVSKIIICVAMVGMGLTVLPRAVAAQKRLEIAASKPRDEVLKLNSNSCIRDGWAANLFVVQKLMPFFWIAGPWIILLWAAPFIGIHLAAFQQGLTPTLFMPSSVKIDVPTELFGERLPRFILTVFAYPTVLVAWHRYVQEKRAPHFISLPNKTVMRYLFRLYMIVVAMGVFGAIAVSNAPDLAHLLGMRNILPVAITLVAAVMCLFTYLGSRFALVLPAIAAGNRSFLGTDSNYIARRLGTTYPIGFAISLLPFGFLALVCTVAIYRALPTGDLLSVSLDGYALQLIPLTTLFLALASCATYLSWNYAAQSQQYIAMTTAQQTTA